MFALWPLLGHADKDSVSNLAAEPPRVRVLLEQVKEIELSVSNSNNTRRAATLYCEASRFGSLEAQYRLGLLYLSGKGVPENRELAAALFSSAAQQGHALAFDMLETVQFHSLELPACMTAPSILPKQPATAGRFVNSGCLRPTIPPDYKYIRCQQEANIEQSIHAPIGYLNLRMFHAWNEKQ